jgi:putative ABC transport system permease protein
MGVNKLKLYGHRNWRLKPSEETTGATFQSFSWASDIDPLRKVFPEIGLLSPVMQAWDGGVEFGGKSHNTDVRLFGVNDEYLAITNATVTYGRFFSKLNLERQDKVCVVGANFPTKLEVSPYKLIGDYAVVKIGQRNTFPCLIVGILKSQKSNNQWTKPDDQVLMPFTSYASVASYWEARIQTVVMKVTKSEDVEDTSKRVLNYFKTRYGKTGEFGVDSDSTLVAQMKRFLSIFSALLGAIAFLSLIVGGIGIHNMMLVSVVDRLKEIGLRKALGATSRSLKVLFLSESMVLCLTAGVIGLVIGFGCCQIGIYAATKFTKELTFEWIFEPFAFALSIASMVGVGVVSGLVPAKKAEKLTVIEALRSE